MRKDIASGGKVFGGGEIVEGMFAFNGDEIRRKRWGSLGCGATSREGGRVNGEAAKMTLYSWPGRKTGGVEGTEVGGSAGDEERSCLICRTLPSWDFCRR